MTSYAQTLKLADHYGSKTVGFQNTNVYDYLNGSPVIATSLGVAADGVTDDTSALQFAINTAHSLGKPLLLPGSTIKINSPISLLGKIVDIRGVANKTVIQAGAPMAKLVDVEETIDASFSPFSISDLTLDGNSLVTDANLAIRYRHNTIVDNVFSINTVRAFKEKDSYLGRRRNIRTNSCQYGLHLIGSNHSSQWDGCSFNGASVTGLLIQALGTALDGNEALKFDGCDIEFGTGNGIDIAALCNASWNASYLGEVISGEIIVNRGGTFVVNDGAVFFGYTANSYACHPIGGRTQFNRCHMAGQTFGSVDKLVNLTALEVSGAAYGQVSFNDIETGFTFSGNPVLPGDPLGYGRPSPAFAPRPGKLWTAETNATTVTTVVTGNSVKVTCTAAPGPSPIIGVQLPLVNQTQWRDGEPLYLVVVYESTKPLNVRTNTSALAGGVTSFGTFPATTGVTTALKFDGIASSASQSIIEMFQNSAAVGDSITVYYCGLADATMIKNGVGTLANVAKI